jgi:hypothetical protein
VSHFVVKCPMCKGTLWINPSTGEVVDHKAADHQKADLGLFLKSQKERGSALEDKFKKAKVDQDKRKQDLDKRFQEAKEHPENLEGEVDSPFKWD